MKEADYKYVCYSDEFQVYVSRLKGEDTVQLHVRVSLHNYLFSLAFLIIPPRQLMYSIYISYLSW